VPSRVVRSDAQFDALGRLLSGLERPFVVEWRKGEDRSHQQNKTMWKWAGEFAAQLGDRTADEVQATWKLTIGVPILRSENEGFCAFYDKAIRPLEYEQKIAAMAYVPVTRIMTVAQMGALMDAIQREAAEQGVTLTIPD
jgi:hypothetical protein